MVRAGGRNRHVRRSRKLQQKVVLRNANADARQAADEQIRHNRLSPQNQRQRARQKLLEDALRLRRNVRNHPRHFDVGDDDVHRLVERPPLNRIGFLHGGHVQRVHAQQIAGIGGADDDAAAAQQVGGFLHGVLGGKRGGNLANLRLCFHRFEAMGESNKPWLGERS